MTSNNENIIRLEQKLDAIDRNMTRTALNTLELIKRFHSPEANEIPWKDLSHFIKNQVIPFNDKVKIQKYKSSDLLIEFKSWFDKDGLVDVHKHPDFTETFIVVTGRIYEVITQTTYGPGEEFFIPAGQAHGIASLDKSYFITIAKKILD